ncbi:(2Fe-2S)-binding protein [Candidatus Uabimicrobium amorphum]|uniref:BFD-like [2Fe-2S]-binding domain-containing protein n=1 Tax=Uabimicrobium amorphum TaxID=2596890 RepID=A0A5S9ILD0_UABAM|nr:(2Fe-2S)-binding protein [Candidatus Uabimicrobium amorphum]BBM84013.1 hypothetical protein UABAM_02368 [Candidatus Uabimicrobium amorphum]
MKFFSKKKKGTVQIIESLTCYCFRIPTKEIVDIIKKHKCRTVEAVQMHCSACEGCGGCRPDIEDLIEECWTKKE